jgi:chromosome segregation ATPase
MSSEKVSGAEQIIPAAIGELLDQRATYQGWLDKLERKRGNASPDVYKKVMADYRERLDQVEDELTGHRTELEATLDEHRDRVEKFEEERSQRSAELEEVELRYAVGEFEEDEWDRLKGEYLAELNTTSERLSEEQDAVRRLEEVLVELSEPARAARAERIEEPEVESQPIADAAPASGDTSPGQKGEKDRKFLDELEFLESLSVDEGDDLDSVSISLEGEESDPRD